MKKTALLIFLPILMLIAVASVPYWVGGAIEKQLRAQSDLFQLQWKQQPGVSYELYRYQRGYLASVVDTRFTFDPQMISVLPMSDALVMAPFSLTFRHTISHGPWIDKGFSLRTMSRIDTVLVPEGEQQATSNFYFGDRGAFAMTTWLEWAGAIRSDGAVPAYRGRDHTGQYDVKWGGVNWGVEGGWMVAQGRGHFNAPRFELANADYGVTVGGLSGVFNRFMPSQGLPFDDGEITLNTFKLRGESSKGIPLAVVLRDMTSAYRVFKREELIDVTQQLEFRLLQINDEKFNRGAIYLALHNLDAAVLHTMQQRYIALTQLPDIDSERLSQVLLQEAQSLLPELLAQAPVIDLNKIEVTTINGQMSGRFKLGIEEGAAVFTSMALPNDFKALLRLARIEIDIKLPATIIEQQARKAVSANIVEQLLDSEQPMTAETLAQQTTRAVEQMLVQFEIQNIIRRETNHYRTKLHYQDGHLYLNGVPADNFLALLPSLKES
ncbi:MAG: YdgA family protein [Gammaproteobacteria bacterium]|nr:YdgA family protein [Gammaproteobacteria bacterium]